MLLSSLSKIIEAEENDATDADDTSDIQRERSLLLPLFLTHTFPIKHTHTYVLKYVTTYAWREVMCDVYNYF